jgi:hypothetical protein
VHAVKSDSALMRVSDASDGIPFDVSDQVFSIKSPITSVVVDGNSIPERFELSQNYPNPFNLGTKINFAVPQYASVELVIFNLNGEKIRTLHNGNLTPGRYTATWDGLHDGATIVASGVYVYRIRIGDWQEARKLTLIK